MTSKRHNIHDRTDRSRWLKKLKSTAAPLKLAGRTGTVQGAFWKAICPHDEFSDEQLAAHLSAFVQGDQAPACVYCGGPATDWDHLLPSRRKDAPHARTKVFTGFGSLLSNLVPACGNCNQSKGSQHWQEWLAGGSDHARRARGNEGHDDRVLRLESLQLGAERDRRPLPEMTGSPDWTRYEMLLKEIGGKLRQADELATAIRAASTCDGARRLI